MKMKKTTFITQGAVIAAIYVVLVFVFDYWSFGPIQFRVAEALTILPVFTPGGSAGAFYRLSDCQYYGWCGYLGYCLWQSCNTDRCSRNLYAAQTSVGSATAADTCKHCYRAVCIKICVWYRRHAVVFYADRGTWGSDCLRCIRQSAQSGIKEVPQYTLS